MRGIHAPHYGPVQAELNGPGIVAPAFFLPLCTEVLRRRILGSSPPALCIATDLHRAVFLEVPSIGWQLFILESYQSDSTAFPSCLDTYATRLLTEPLTRIHLPGPLPFLRLQMQVGVAVGSVLTAGITGRNAHEEWRRRREELEDNRLLLQTHPRLFGQFLH